MRRLPLALTAALVLGCGDDVPQDSASSTGSSSGDSSSSGSTSPEETTEGSSSTTEVTTGVDSSTGPVDLCGNGELDGDEQCDDGNNDNGDGCYSNCTLPFEVLWTETEDGGDDDYAADAVFDAEGNLYVLGASEVGGQYDVWLRQYQPDGTEGWTYTFDGMMGLDDVGDDLAWHESGDLLIIGSTETMFEDDILVMRLGIDDQVPVWTDIYDGPGTGMEMFGDLDHGRGIIGAANGDVIAVGRERVDGEEFNIWIRRYDGDGNEQWTQTYNDAGFNGFDAADTVVEDQNGDLYVIGDTEVAQNDLEMWVRKLDAGGGEIWTRQVADFNAVGAAIDPDNNLVLGGAETDNPGNLNIWVAKYDPEFALVSMTEHDGPSGLFDFGRGLSVDANGDVYIAGLVTVVGEQENLWAGRFSSDLQQLWWSDMYGNEGALLADQGNHMAVSDDGSRAAVVGFETVVGEGISIWVRMYQNNPTP